MQDILHKTLIIRFSSVGDIVLSTLLVRVLHLRFPHCQIDYLVKSEFAELIRGNPHIADVIEFPAEGTFRDLVKARRVILARQYDLIVDIHDSLRSRLLCLGSRGVVRIRKRKIARFFLVKCKRNLYGLFGGAPSVADRYVETVAHLGVADDGKGLELYLPKTSIDTAQHLLSGAVRAGLPLIGICPSAKHATKIWPGRRFADTAAALAAGHRAAIVILGGPGDEAQSGDVASMIKAADPTIAVLNLAGRASLLVSAAVMDRCSLIITNDSGLMHIAAARKRKIIAVFGSTVRQLGFFPFGTLSAVVEHPDLPCRPCTHIGLPTCPKGHFKCMNEIPAQHVIRQARELLSV